MNYEFKFQNNNHVAYYPMPTLLGCSVDDSGICPRTARCWLGSDVAISMMGLRLAAFVGRRRGSFPSAGGVGLPILPASHSAELVREPDREVQDRRLGMLLFFCV